MGNKCWWLVAVVASIVGLGCSGDDGSGRGASDGDFDNPDPGGLGAGTAGVGAGAGAGCGMADIDPMVTFDRGNLLVVFDRSMSMATPFEGGQNRLQAAQAALKAALAPLVCSGADCADDISAALLTFPTQDNVAGLDEMNLTCTVADLGSPEQLNWQGVTPFYNNFDGFWASRTLNNGGQMWPGMFPLLFGTPISVAFARADQALQDPAVMGNKAVLFLTDGEEIGECSGGVNGVQTARRWWDEQGIRTYVVNLAEGGGGANFNRRVAEAGGTGQVINPSSSQALADEIAGIVQSAVGQTSCQITLQQGRLVNPETACAQGDVRVSGSSVPCDQDRRREGFFVVDDTTIRVVGSYCDTLQREQDLTANFPCDAYAPI